MIRLVKATEEEPEKLVYQSLVRTTLEVLGTVVLNKKVIEHCRNESACRRDTLCSCIRNTCQNVQSQPWKRTRFTSLQSESTIVQMKVHTVIYLPQNLLPETLLNCILLS